MAYANIQNSGKLRTNTGSGLSWSPGSTPTLNNLLTLRCWGWNGGGGYSPGTTDARDSSGTPKNFTRDSPLPTGQGGGNTGIYSLVIPSGLTTPLLNVNTATALVGIFDEWSGGATSSVANVSNSQSTSSVAAGATAGASISTGANAGLVLTAMMDMGSGGAVNIATSGTSFNTPNGDAVEQDNNNYQAGVADKRTASVASATVSNTYARGSGAAARVDVIVSYNLLAAGGPQDTPELWGRPDGMRGQNHMQQLLAA